MNRFEPGHKFQTILPGLRFEIASLVLFYWVKSAFPEAAIVTCSTPNVKEEATIKLKTYETILSGLAGDLSTFRLLRACRPRRRRSHV